MDRRDSSDGGPPRPLERLLPSDVLGSVRGDPEVRVTGIATNSKEVTEGELFVAIRGSETDGHAFIEDAVRRGAAAIVVEDDPETDLGVPVLRVEDSRAVLAEAAAAWYDHPGERMTLVGITGTVGKTSTLSMLEAVLTEAGTRVATIGSLGLRIQEETVEKSGYTTPDPLLLHRDLARAADAGCEIAAMEVTSHALVQKRMHGLKYDLGIFTTLLPLEHSDYHRTFQNYVDAKRVFFDHLRPCVPLVFSADNRAVRKLVHASEAEPVGCGTDRVAVVQVGPGTVSPEGTRVEVDVRRSLPRADGGEVAPTRFPLELRLLGRSNVMNATLAAAAGLCLGAEPDAIREALACIPPLPRRVQVIHDGRFIVLDDTVGHPDSISALFDVVERLQPRRVRIAFAVRGQRGERINHETATALGVWAEHVDVGELIVTRSAEAADELNRVEDVEHRAFCEALSEYDVDFTERERLDDAVRAVLEGAEDGDLVLLLGAQGMDGGQEIAREWLRGRDGG